MTDLYEPSDTGSAAGRTDAALPRTGGAGDV
jgi:hypothetical protein